MQFLLYVYILSILFFPYTCIFDGKFLALERLVRPLFLATRKSRSLRPLLLSCGNVTRPPPATSPNKHQLEQFFSPSK